MTTRLADVAIHAGVSEATVSRVINNKAGVADATRRTVLDAAQQLGYDRTVRARSTSTTIGVIVPELENPVFATFAQRLENLLVQRDQVPLLGTQTATGISEDEWVEVLRRREAAGIVIVSGMHADTHAPVDRYRRLRDRDVPLVLINGYQPDIDAAFISDDDVAAMGMAVSHLAALGHTRVGLAVGPERYVPVIRKVDGFTAAAENEPGIDIATIEYSLFTIEGGYAAAMNLLDQGITAIVCGSDLMALGAIRAAGVRGLDVPGDVSIVGYDDSALIAFTNPPLTTIRQNVTGMAMAAVRLLLDEIAGTPAPRNEYLFRPELIVRGSTGPRP